MRACLLLCAALALAPGRPRAAASPHPPSPTPSPVQPARLEHIKTQILTKLGLSARPTPLGAPPRDVVRQILARAADSSAEREPEPEHSMREIIAIAHRELYPNNHGFAYSVTLRKMPSAIFSSWKAKNTAAVTAFYDSYEE